MRTNKINKNKINCLMNNRLKKIIKKNNLEKNYKIQLLQIKIKKKMKKNKKMNLKFLKAHNLFYNLFHIMKIPLNLYLNHI